MNALPVAMSLSLLFSAAAPLSPLPAATVWAASPQAEAEEPAVPTIPPSSQPGEPVTYEARLPVLMYHHVVYDWMECNEMTVTAGRLERDLQWLKENGYHTVLPRELALGLPLPERAVLITFDDGYRSNYDLAFPLLKKYHAKASIALMAYMQDVQAPNFLTWDMCREMAASGLVEFGSHGYIIHNLDGRMGNFAAGQANGVERKKGESDIDFRRRVLEDLRYSYERIAAELGRPPSYFAYPFGKTDPDADAFLEDLFPMTVVTGPGKHSADLSRGLHTLPRFTVTMKAEPRSFLNQ